eukprot:917659-Amphidinium_carterae.1
MLKVNKTTAPNLQIATEQKTHELVASRLDTILHVCFLGLALGSTMLCDLRAGPKLCGDTSTHRAFQPQPGADERTQRVSTPL